MAEKIEFSLPQWMKHNELGAVEVLRTSYFPYMIRVKQVSTSIEFDVPLDSLKVM